jgi:transcription-repair coupling factor (superfamily II helicase)
LGVQKLDASENVIQLTFMPNPPIDPMKIISLIQSKRHYHLAGQDKLRVETHIEDVALRVVRIRELFKELS